jgi:hypothetical protein
MPSQIMAVENRQATSDGGNGTFNGRLWGGFIRVGLLALHLRQVAVLDVVAFGRAFDKFQELPQAFAFWRL